MVKCKIGNILEMATRRAKRSDIWDSGGTLGSKCTLSGSVHLPCVPSFMPKYDNFEKRPVSRKPLLVERK